MHLASASNIVDADPTAESADTNNESHELVAVSFFYRSLTEI